MVFRLYRVYRDTGKCTGAKRDYPSKEHFLKYGLETYERYNQEFYFNKKETNTRAKLCYLENNKWVELVEHQLKELGL